MSPPTPPPPPSDPSTAEATTKTVSQSPARPPTTNPYPFYTAANTPQRLPSNPNPNYPQLAPRPPQHPLATDPTHQLLYPSREFVAQRPGPRPPPMFTFPYWEHPSQAGLARPSGHVMMMPDVVRGAPMMAASQLQHHQLKGGPSGSITENGHKAIRDRNKDDDIIIVRDRKVRIAENATLYSLCRLWLRNGFPEETQPQYLDFVKPLSRPLPDPAQESPEKDVGNEEEHQDEELVKHLSTKDLLRRHVERAKRVRSRLREKRLQRITRFKTRLGLLLHPPMVEQQQLKTEANSLPN